MDYVCVFFFKNIHTLMNWWFDDPIRFGFEFQLDELSIDWFPSASVLCIDIQLCKYVSHVIGVCWTVWNLFLFGLFYLFYLLTTFGFLLLFFFFFFFFFFSHFFSRFHYNNNLQRRIQPSLSLFLITHQRDDFLFCSESAGQSFSLSVSFFFILAWLLDLSIAIYLYRSNALLLYIITCNSSPHLHPPPLPPLPPLRP